MSSKTYDRIAEIAHGHARTNGPEIQAAFVESLIPGLRNQPGFDATRFRRIANNGRPKSTSALRQSLSTTSED